MKKSVALLVFNPFTNDSRVLKESKTLSKDGYEVEVIAHGNKNLPEKESMDGFEVIRLLYLDRKVTKSKIKKLLIYLKWLVKSTIYVKKFDIVHCNDLNTLPIGVTVKKLFNKNLKIVYDAHEYEIETNGLKGIQKSLIKFLERELIKYVDEVVTVSNSIANEYKKLYNIDKPAVVLNCPKYTSVKKSNIFRDKFGIKKEQSIFLYQGSLSRGRGLEIILETFKRFSNQTEIDKNSIPVVVFMGYGELESIIKNCSKEYKNIFFHNAVTPDRVLDYTSSADFGLSIIEDSCLSYRYSLPNKMFEYLMAELPIIVSDLPEMGEFIRKYGLGLVVEEFNTDSLKKTILKAEKIDGEQVLKNIKRVKEIFNWQEQEKILLNIYRGLRD